MLDLFEPTKQQQDIINHEGSVFVGACPGAGKTRVLVERARRVLARKATGRSLAFLSFTNAAVSELEGRLRREGLLPTPLFPHFIGTFDAFLWQFLLVPFGIPACAAPPRLIPDLDQREIRPFSSARSIALSCFSRLDGSIVPEVARKLNFNPARELAARYRTAALNARHRFRTRGEIDFEDVRLIVTAKLRDAAFAGRLVAALASRFQEVVVDEAQDCNPADLEIIRWLRDAGIATKVICDPHQSIYGFRGGVTDQLLAFRDTFEPEQQLPMTGNFRSTKPICHAIVQLRQRDARVDADEALGRNKDISIPVHILSYAGTSVPRAIGAAYARLLSDHGLALADCPILAKTHDSGANAIGQPTSSGVLNLTMRVAMAVTGFHFSLETGNRRAAMQAMHEVLLAIGDKLDTQTYGQYIAAAGITGDMWRPGILELLHTLRYDPSTFPTPQAWHAHAKTVLEPHFPNDGRSMSQRLPWNSALEAALSVPPPVCPVVKSIHAAKGSEFPAVCVVMTARTAKGIVDFLLAGEPLENAEAAREIYVAASRAEQLLVIAVPRSQASRLATHLSTPAHQVTPTPLEDD